MREIFERVEDNSSTFYEVEIRVMKCRMDLKSF